MNLVEKLKDNGLLAEFVYLKLENKAFRDNFKDYRNSDIVKNYIEGLNSDGKKQYIPEKQTSPVTKEQLEKMTDIKPERQDEMLALLDKYEIKEFSSDDGFLNSDFQAMLLQNKETGEYTIAFRGTESKKDWLVDAAIALDTNPQYNEAIEFTLKCIEKYNIKKEDLTLTGHSLGGILVQMVGSTLEIKGYAYNPLGSFDLVHPVFPNAFEALDKYGLYTSSAVKFANENIINISYNDAGTLNGDLLSNFATKAAGTKHLGQVINIVGENLGFDAHSMIPSNKLLEQFFKKNIQTLEDIEKHNKQMLEQKDLNSHEQRQKDWQNMSPEQKATAIKNGYGLGLSFNTQGIEDLRELSIDYAQKFEQNTQQRVENINLAINNINIQETLDEKINLLEQTNIASNLDNPYSKQLIEQYQEKVIQNKGSQVSDIDFLNMQLTPNQTLASNNLENEQTQKTYLSFEAKQNLNENNNIQIQTMS